MSDDFDSPRTHDLRVFKCGNSLVVRIPKAIAESIGLEDGAVVEMAIARETIYVRKAPLPALADLIERITPRNVQQPVYDRTIGAERW